MSLVMWIVIATLMLLVDGIIAGAITCGEDYTKKMGILVCQCGFMKYVGPSHRVAVVVRCLSLTITFLRLLVMFVDMS